jgi:hypothetical protein
MLQQDRYSAFLRIMREWRNLKTLKRSGQGHNPDGCESTRDGECALLCPACPQPGKNLPEGWENAPADRRFAYVIQKGPPPLINSSRWLYALFLAIDANFRLKRKTVSSDDNDPSLNAGSSYFVEECAYKAYLAKQANLPQEVSIVLST